MHNSSQSSNERNRGIHGLSALTQPYDYQNGSAQSNGHSDGGHYGGLKGGQIHNRSNGLSAADNGRTASSLPYDHYLLALESGCCLEILHQAIWFSCFKMKTSNIVHFYRRRRDSETDLERDQGQVLPAELQDFNNHNGYQRSQVLISSLGHLLLGNSSRLALLKITSCSYPRSLTSCKISKRLI